MVSEWIRQMVGGWVPRTTVAVSLPQATGLACYFALLPQSCFFAEAYHSDLGPTNSTMLPSGSRTTVK